MTGRAANWPAGQYFVSNADNNANSGTSVGSLWRYQLRHRPCHLDKRSDAQCILVPANLFQVGDEGGQRGVGVGDFAVVQTILVGLGIGRRRFVIVRIVEVDPDEMGPAG